MGVMMTDLRSSEADLFFTDDLIRGWEEMVLLRELAALHEATKVRIRMLLMMC
jgi:hypothetical protein